MKDNVGSKIKKYLDEHGISMTFLGNVTGIGFYKVFHYLSGDYKKFPVEYYIKICDALNVDYNYFLKDEE